MKYRGFFLSLLLAAALTLPAAAAAFLPVSSQNNSAPIAQNLVLTTYKGIAITSRFAATDPDGDPITYQVVSSPARGQVTVDEQDSAAFWYTPYEGKKGKDSFTYVATDSMGNTSKPATVKVVIEKQNSRVTYSDLDGEACAYAAQRLAERGIYVGRQVNGNYCFDPGETFNHQEFLALAMAVAEVEPLEGVTVTGFFDDGDISLWAKGYVSAALMTGAVQGSRNDDGQAVFLAEEPITCAQATVIADRLLATGDVKAQPTMAVPDWAAQSAANMEALSVIDSTARMDEPLTRSEAARMLSAMLDVMDHRKSGWMG